MIKLLFTFRRNNNRQNLISTVAKIYPIEAAMRRR